MNFMNKYEANLSLKDQQIKIYTAIDTATFEMNNQIDNVKIFCRLNQQID